MSMYNMMHGVDDLAPTLLKMLHLDGDKFACLGRFRDAYLNEDGTKVIILTRNGGGNREEYQWVFDDLKKMHPCYLTDYDDDFDSTYAYIEFTVPEECLEETKALATGKKPKTLKEKTDETLAEIEKMSKEELEKDPRFSEMTKIMKMITE